MCFSNETLLKYDTVTFIPNVYPNVYLKEGKLPRNFRHFTKFILVHIDSLLQVLYFKSEVTKCISELFLSVIHFPEYADKVEGNAGWNC